MNDFPSGSSLRTFQTGKMTLGFGAGEIYFRLDDVVVILTPAAAKKLVHDLRELVPSSLDSHQPEKPKTESAAQKIIRSLYRSHHPSKSVVTINTTRKKSLPDGS